MAAEMNQFLKTARQRVADYKKSAEKSVQNKTDGGASWGKAIQQQLGRSNQQQVDVPPIEMDMRPKQGRVPEPHLTRSNPLAELNAIRQRWNQKSLATIIRKDIRNATFGTTQMIDDTNQALYGTTHQSQIGSEGVYLGMNRSVGGVFGKRLAERAKINYYAGKDIDDSVPLLRRSEAARFTPAQGPAGKRKTLL